MIQHFPVLIPLLPLTAGMLSPLLSKIYKQLGKWVVLAAIAVSLIGTIFVLAGVLEAGEPTHYWMGNWAPPLGIEFVIDSVNGIILIAIAAISLFVGIFATPFVKKDTWLYIGGYYSMFGLLVSGLLGLAITGDLFNLYVFLEITSLAGYGLIALGGKKSILAAFRYLLIGTIAASFYLLALAYLYGITGTLNMADMAVLIAPHLDSVNVLLAMAMLIIGFGIKMALFPLHGWQPDAYTYAHPGAAPLISGAMSKVPALALLRFAFYIFGADSVFVEKGMFVVGILGACGIILGSVMAIAQKDFRRMLAYSSVAQIGYIAAGLSMGNYYGLIAVVLHIVNHAFMKSTLFMVAGAVRYRFGETKIDRFGKLHKYMPFTVFALVVAALAMVGVPPTGGFFSKWYLVLGAMDGGQYYFIAVIVVSSLLNAIYFFRVLENIFMGEDAGLKEVNPGCGKMELPWQMFIPVVLFGIAIVAIGLGNGIIVDDIISVGLPEVFLR